MDTPARSSAPEAVFRAHGLSKTYGSGEVEVRALHDVDLEIARGDADGPLGRPGGGECCVPCRPRGPPEH